ncbi:glutamine-hydrolyzing carbamoyl-phosphate synthase small subunit [Candidatus Desulfovibrio trichonymphae]|uniref:Carbamoyl phosphate synthase small chain n=1 Tax=Candidatus Desulfovibrio trichonymphae TaxID=1725232 RepID=A0A1J1E2N7_9BACT|nr:glutamine-hydrolyzing carbamoyl-phosphate synthase small subunit [Candidatus Desulfovibrio trichonymphae]BAV91696.1 carbamoyl phosphate synthase small subunit [Candidatus Desulfovibrio trichonymphae]GHU91222.1 carbamoyl-phosphate synthase small chain [Deltaproteobacteria bacterium]GHU94805.1 carbamoyl-phosphate synthase small chain [Deltaproteobacteria bacterium]
MQALLTLEDGFSLVGKSCTGEFETGGEVIFNTCMTGYQEVLTDPSYYGQMVCMTWPLIGNYGINNEDMESDRVHLRALLVKECCKKPSSWRAVMSLPDFLQRHNTPGIEGLDTRALTRHLRMHGAMRGMISTKNLVPRFLQERARALPPMQGQNLVPFVAAREPYFWTNNGLRPASFSAAGAYAWQGSGVRLLVYDYGIKWNILRELVATGFEPLAVPPLFSVEQAKASGAQAVFLSNGPGDPAALTEETALTRELIAHFPVTGICLGHQLIGHALGGTTAKLRFGHHGCNHPVKDITTGRIELSSQNHGFHVVLDGMDDVEATHVNLNDHTLEGLRHKSLPVMGVQYHPEAAAGPHDGRYLFSRFYDVITQAASF